MNHKKVLGMLAVVATGGVLLFQNCGPSTEGSLSALNSAASSNTMTALYYSTSGPLNGKTCTQIYNTNDPNFLVNGLDNNYICTDYDYGMVWSQSSAVSGYYCASFNNPALPASAKWSTTNLCTPVNYGLTMSFTGPVANMACIAINSPETGWTNAYLCYNQGTGQGQGI